MNSFYPTLFSFALAFSIPLANVHCEDASGSEAAPLSLDEVVREALLNNPTIQSARETWNAMKARVPQAGAWVDPKVSFQQTMDRFVAVQHNAFTDDMLSAEQSIPISGRNLSRARAADAEAVAAFEQMRRQELDVIAEATAGYFRLANAYTQIDLNRKNLVSLQLIEEASRSRYSAGDESAVFVLMAQTECNKLLETARDLDLELSTEQSKLNVLLGRDAFAPLGQPKTAASPPGVLPADNLKSLLFKYRPEILIAGAKVQQERALLQLAHRDWIPDPAISVQGQRYNGASQGVSEVDAGISFNVPWVNAGKYRAEVAEATCNLRASEADLQQAKNEGLGKLREVLERLDTSHHHLQLFRDKLIPQAQQAFNAGQLAYENGKLSFTDWIAAQRTLRDLQATEQDHLTDYNAAFAELEAVIGLSLPQNHATEP